MRHQKLHLVCQYAAVAQNKVFPQTGDIRCVQQRHIGLLGRAAAFAVVAGAACCDDIHPRIYAFLRKWNDVFACQIFFMKMAAAIRAHIAVTHKQLAVGQARFEFKRVDFWHALGANDAVDGNDRLVARDGIVTTVKCRHARTHFPTHLIRCVMQYGFFQADPRLRQSLR